MNEMAAAPASERLTRRPDGSRFAYLMRSRAVSIGVLLGVMAVAAALRFINLDANFIWWDEGINAFFAHTSLPDHLAWTLAVADNDPPVHRLMLALWLAVFGDSAFNLRSLTALLGVGLVGVVYAWGSWLIGRGAGLLAALLIAVSPIAVYYSREAKAYPVVTFFGLLALYLWFRYLRQDSTRHLWAWPAYVVAGTIAFGSHYYAAFLFVPPGVSLIADLLSRSTTRTIWIRSALGWLAAHIAILLLILPWGVFTWAGAFMTANRLSGTAKAYDLWQYLQVVLSELAAGPHAPSRAAALAAAALFGAAFYGLYREHKRLGAPLAVLVAAGLILAFIAQIWVKFQPRFLLYLVPALCLMAATGMVRLKLLAVVPLTCLAIGWWWALPAAYQPALGPQEDLRPLVQELRDKERPGDVVVLTYIWQEGILRMYAPEQRTYAQGWQAHFNVDSLIPGLIEGHPRIWLLTYRVSVHDQFNPVGMWFETRAASAWTKETGPYRLSLYLAPCSVPPEGSAEAVFEKGIHLYVGTFARTVRADEAISIPMAWKVESQVQDPYKVFLHLLDSSGNKIWQQDATPGNWLRPFEQMKPGEIVPDCRAAFIPADASPGTYKLVAGVYGERDGARLSLTGSAAGQDEFVVGEIEVLPPARK